MAENLIPSTVIEYTFFMQFLYAKHVYNLINYWSKLAKFEFFFSTEYALHWWANGYGSAMIDYITEQDALFLRKKEEMCGKDWLHYRASICHLTMWQTNSQVKSDRISH